MYLSIFIKYPSAYIRYSNENIKDPTAYSKHPQG